MKIRISSFGCRLNQAEIQSVATSLRENGHELVEGGDADVHIINTCVVTGSSEGKARRLVSQAIRAAGTGGGGRVIVTGCAESLRETKGLVFVGNDHKYLIPDIVEHWQIAGRIGEHAPSRFVFDAPLGTSRTRVHMKIQDGCDRFCAYCIIPGVRGVPQSRPAEDIFAEFDSLIGKGFKEIVLTGVMIGNYSSGRYDLAALVSSLLKKDGDFRLHLSSLNPDSVTPGLTDLLGHDKIVRHLHLSLQSGSDIVLARMNRRYTGKDYMRIIDRVRNYFPLFNFTTDIIVGFPGETESDFADTMSLIRDAGFSHVHTFRFSPRPGTAAASMGDTVTEAVKSKRSAAVTGLYKAQKSAYYSAFDGMRTVLLSERFRNGYTSGFNEFYVPVVVAGKLERNRFYPVETKRDDSGTRLVGTLAG